MTDRPPPRFVGVSTYQDKLGRYSFRFPTGWQQLDLEDRDGARFVPNADDPETALTGWVIELEHLVVAEDLDELRAGVNQGLAQLADCQVVTETETVFGNLIRFEREFTFRESNARRQRRFWMLYLDKWLIVLVWQGSNETEFTYWLPMANYAFQTFRIPDALWFATDRALIEERERQKT